MEKDSNIVLFGRFMRGETSVDEERQLMEWLYSSVGRKQLMDYYHILWLRSDKELSTDVQQRMFAQIKSRIHVAPKENKRQGLSFSRRFLRYAAIVMLILGGALGGGVYTSYFGKSKITKEYLVNTDKGQRANVTLPDGTKVWLNSYTKLSYDADYGEGKRVVSLVGEAFFEVAKDKEHPFIVKTDDMEVEALGTTFNVKAYEDDARIIATLFSGSVRVSAGRYNVILSPDEGAIWRRKSGKLAVRKLDNSNYAKMWRDNELVFSGETLEEIAVILNRMYNVQIVFKSDEIKKFRFTGVICNNSLDNIIELISLTSPITYKTVGDTIELNNR